MPWLTARLVMIGVAILAVLALLSIGRSNEHRLEPHGGGRGD